MPWDVKSSSSSRIGASRCRGATLLPAVAALALWSCASTREREGPPEEPAERSRGPTVYPRSVAAPAPPPSSPDPTAAVDLRRALAIDRAGRLRVAVQDVSHAPFQDAGPPAGRALRATHDALALVPGAAASGRLDGLESAASELAEIRAASLDRADHIKAGLEHAVAALRASVRADALLQGWVAAAADAVAAVDPATPLGLQRARVQDAFRAVADAIILALERESG